MTTQSQTEALKLALEALETDWGTVKAITAIKEALAQPEQEPYGYLKLNTGKFVNEVEGLNPMKDKRYLPLYTTPPQRKPLTDEEIGAILEGVNAYGTRLYTFARAIEAKLREKNT